MCEPVTILNLILRDLDLFEDYFTCVDLQMLDAISMFVPGISFVSPVFAAQKRALGDVKLHHM